MSKGGTVKGLIEEKDLVQASCSLASLCSYSLCLLLLGGFDFLQLIQTLGHNIYNIVIGSLNLRFIL